MNVRKLTGKYLIELTITEAIDLSSHLEDLLAVVEERTDNLKHLMCPHGSNNELVLHNGKLYCNNDCDYNIDFELVIRSDQEQDQGLKKRSENN